MKIMCYNQLTGGPLGPGAPLSPCWNNTANDDPGDTISTVYRPYVMQFYKRS